MKLEEDESLLHRFKITEIILYKSFVYFWIALPFCAINFSNNWMVLVLISS
jgi:hypothetical protein